MNDGILYSCLSAGGTMLASTGIEVVVSVRAVVAYDIEMQQLEAQRAR